MFTPGETVQHKFIIPFVASEVAKVVVTYKQGDQIILVKTVTSNDITAVGGAEAEFSYVLTQEESMLFSGEAGICKKGDYLIQLNVKTVGGARAASCIIKGSTGIQTYQGVI